MADPFTIASAGLKGLSFLSGLGAKRKEQELQEQQLIETLQNNFQNYQLATSDREDAFGNKTVYVPGQGFVQQNTELTDAIINASQNEQLKNLTVDANRNREGRENASERASSADAIFKSLLNERENRNDQSLEDFQLAQISRDAEIAKNKRNNPVVDALSSLSLRQGNPAAMSQIVAALEDQALSPIEQFYNSQDEGERRFFERNQNQNNLDFNELNFLQDIASNFGQSNISFENYSSQQGQNQNEALSTLINTLTNNSRSNSSAANSLTNNVSGTDFNLLSEILGMFEADLNIEEEDEELIAALRAAELSGARLQNAQNEDELSRYFLTN